MSLKEIITHSLTINQSNNQATKLMAKNSHLKQEKKK